MFGNIVKRFQLYTLNNYITWFFQGILEFFELYRAISQKLLFGRQTFLGHLCSIDNVI